MGTGSRPESPGRIEIESADDFILASPTVIDGATFTGLLPADALLSSIGNVVVEIYRVFPNDSDVTRTAGPPTFSTPQVPTRVNSPSDVALDSREAATGTLRSLLSPVFTVANTVLNGIHPQPNQTTFGDGPATGQEARFQVTFTRPFLLPAGHYFFIPQVQLAAGDFLWLSAPKPTTPPFTPDLQSWIRNGDLDPDWLRIGTDIVGGTPPPTFNASFSLGGQTGFLFSVPNHPESPLFLVQGDPPTLYFDLAGFGPNGAPNGYHRSGHTVLPSLRGAGTILSAQVVGNRVILQTTTGTFVSRDGFIYQKVV
jgi:hypothetical protein